MAENNSEQHSGRFAIIPSVALDDPRITLTLIKLLCVIGSYGNKDGYCRVKLATLASRMSHDGKPVGKSAISNGLKKLRELGYLEVLPRFAKDIGQLANSYRILFDSPEKMPQKVNPGSPLEVNPGTSPEVNPGTPLEVNPLNDLRERSKRTILSTAAASLYPARNVNGSTPEATPEAAAAEVENDVSQTAEACRKHLRMGHDKLAGLKLIVACWPGRRAWLENQANLCFQTLKIRPLQLNHFSNWLDTAETRRTAPREEGASHDLRSDETNTSAPHPPAPADQRGPDGLTDAEREAVREQLNALVAQTIRPHAAG